MIRPALPSFTPKMSERFADWVMRRHEVAHREIVLHRRRIYIVPTRFGFYYAAMLAVLLASAMNYNNSMVFGLTFLLAGLGTNAMWYAHRNLLNVRVEYLGAHPVFAGEEARFRFRLHNPSRLPRVGLTMRWRDLPGSTTYLPPSGVDDVSVPRPLPPPPWDRPGSPTGEHPVRVRKTSPGLGNTASATRCGAWPGRHWRAGKPPW
jgi:hypothetical protein